MQHCNIAHSPQRGSVLVGPDLRAGRFMACTVTLLGRLGDPPLPHSLARMRSLNTHAGAEEWLQMRFSRRSARGLEFGVSAFGLLPSEF